LVVASVDEKSLEFEKEWKFILFPIATFLSLIGMKTTNFGIDRMVLAGTTLQFPGRID
jgi:hypothetical protein